MADPKHAKKKGSGRVYTVEDVEYPSVTTILGMLPKPLARWAAKEAANYVADNADAVFALLNQGHREAAINNIKMAPFNKRDKKGELGTLIHSAMESYLGGRDDEEIVNELKAEEVGYFYGVLHFLDAVEPQILFTERTMVSKKYGYAGTADIIGMVDGHKTVIDLKTSKACYTSHGAQIAAYAKAEWMVDSDDALIETGKADRGMVVIVNDDGEFTATPFNDLHPWFNLFMAAYGVWDMNGLKVPESLRV